MAKMTMKLTIAEALRRVDVLKGRFDEDSARARTVFAWREDRMPEFKFDELMIAAEASREELIRLKTQLAIANATTKVAWKGEDRPLIELVHRQAELKGKIAFLKEKLAGRNDVEMEQQAEGNDQYGRTMFKNVPRKWSSAMSEPDRVKATRVVADELAELTNIINAANGATKFDWSPPDATPVTE